MDCRCGCGEPAPLATRTDTRRGWVIGQPKPFVNGHQARATATYPVLGDEAWLRARYVDEGMTTYSMADVIGCSPTTVLVALKAHGIPTRNPGYKLRGIVHGTYYAYIRYRCRCPLCREANSVKCQRRWEAKRLRETVAILAAWSPPPAPLMLMAGDVARCRCGIPLTAWNRTGLCHRCAAAERCKRTREARTRHWIAGSCVECGRAYVARVVGGGAAAKYCSETCAMRNHRRRDKKRRDKRIREGSKREAIDLAQLAERDGWRCHLCHRPVGRKTWSIDHLVPLSHGGEHTWENVALAHWLCNVRRGHRGHAQLRLG